jgi:hypothetical protein
MLRRCTFCDDTTATRLPTPAKMLTAGHCFGSTLSGMHPHSDFISYCTMFSRQTRLLTGVGAFAVGVGALTVGAGAFVGVRTLRGVGLGVGATFLTVGLGLGVGLGLAVCRALSEVSRRVQMRSWCSPVVYGSSQHSVQCWCARCTHVLAWVLWALVWGRRACRSKGKAVIRHGVCWWSCCVKTRSMGWT